MRFLAIIALLANLWTPAFADELGMQTEAEGVAAATKCSPNPNANPYASGTTATFSDGCPLPAAGLNAIGPHQLSPGTYTCATITVGADDKITVVNTGNCSGTGGGGNCLLVNTGSCLLVNTGSVLLIK